MMREKEIRHSSSSKRSSSSSSRKITDHEISEYLVKKAVSIAKKLKPQSISGYSSDSNPFGDTNLNEAFVWRKKIENSVTQGHPLPEIVSVRAEAKRRRDREAEIENARKGREERAIKKARREEEAVMLAREIARAEAQEWEKREQEFLLQQSKMKSKIRLQEGRARPIDVLIKHLDLSEDGLEKDSGDVDIKQPPCAVFKGLTLTEIEELRGEIEMNMEVDGATPTRVKFWAVLMVVCEWELAENAQEKAPFVHGGVHTGVEADVINVLQGKSYKELETLHSQIDSLMRSGEAKVVEYWEAVLKLIPIYKSKAYLKELHATNVTRIGLIKHPVKSEKNVGPSLNSGHSPEPLIDSDEDNDEQGSFSPQLVYGDENEEATEPAQDLFELEQKRKSVLEQQRRHEAIATKAMGTMEEGDALFGSNAEVNLDSQVYWWHDKYRPRKPKYFNRVHTGYVWNKYNQSHYDHDNPPPKTVQGYKFNIFYPDLVSPSRVPEYTIEKDGNNEGTCIIRFHAGPPYEDIAFRVVNREWDYSRKKGFKCTFERGMLQLYFNFKRCPYRR